MFNRQNIRIPIFRSNWNHEHPKMINMDMACNANEKMAIRSSFYHNMEKKNHKSKEIPNQHQYSIEEIMQISKNEEIQSRNIREYISNEKLLFKSLSELKGVDPKDPLFDQFYNKNT